eukprot:13326-Heterococcus_DN1.PRE.2
MQQCDTAAAQQAEEQLQNPSSLLEANVLVSGSGAQRLERSEVPETARIGNRRACDWCSANKRRCDREENRACKQCIRRDKPCVFTVKRNGRPVYSSDASTPLLSFDPRLPEPSREDGGGSSDTSAQHEQQYSVKLRSTQSEFGANRRS